MPLPVGSPKTKTQLENQADVTYKDNGGSDLTKTRGADVRQFVADLLESAVLKTEDFVETRFTNNIVLDKEAQHFANSSFLPLGGNLSISATNAKNGVVAKVYHQQSIPPNLNFSGFDFVYSATQKETYDSSKINVYVFIAIVRGGIKVCEWTMYRLNP